MECKQTETKEAETDKKIGNETITAIEKLKSLLLLSPLCCSRDFQVPEYSRAIELAVSVSNSRNLTAPYKLEVIIADDGKKKAK